MLIIILFIFGFTMSPMNTPKRVVQCHPTRAPPAKSSHTRDKKSNAFQIAKEIVGMEEAFIREGAIRCVIVVHDDTFSDDV